MGDELQSSTETVRTVTASAVPPQLSARKGHTMRISDLSKLTGVPVPTIKFYIRSGLVPEGQCTSRTQAQYDQSHVRRLRLARALLGKVGLSIAAARTILSKITDQSLSMQERLRVAHRELSANTNEVDTRPAIALMQRWGWLTAEEDGDELKALAGSLETFTAVGVAISQDKLDAYARAMRDTAELEIAEIPDESMAEAVQEFLFSIVLAEPLLLSLRHLALLEASRLLN